MSDSTDLHRHVLIGFGLLVIGLLISIVTPWKMEGISIQLLGGFSAVMAALVLVAQEDE